MTRPSPGPWTWDGSFPITIYDAEGYHVISPGGMFPSGAANARLILAAPDLLEAAKRLVDVASEDRPEEWAAATFALEEAIAKAEGR